MLNNYKYKIAFFLCSILSLQAWAQSFTSSPYSRFGVGDITSNSFQPGVAMGGTAIAQRTNHSVNFNNPASYTAFDSLSFVFDISLTNKNINYITNTQSSKDNNTNINHFALGFPVTKRWFSSIGLVPYSNVGYNISESIPIDTFNLQNTYKGTGGINQFIIGNAFKIFTLGDTLIKETSGINTIYYNTKVLSFGINSSFLFGALERHTASVFPDEAYLFDMYTSNKTIVNDFAFKFGLQYTYNRIEINKLDKINKYTIITGFTFDNQNDVNAHNTSLVTKYLNIGGSVTIDTIENQINEKGNIRFPMNIGAGFAFINREKLTFAIDYKWQQWSTARFFGNNDSLVNSQSIAAGLQFIPESNRQNKYYKMINYRIGGHYTKTYLNIRNQNINDYGISFGLGLPIRKPDKSEVSSLRKKLPPMINIAVEIGQRGTVKNDLIKEKYVQISLNLSLYDIWFIKRKFN